MKHLIFFTFFALISSIPVFSQYQISGLIRDSISAEPLAYTKVSLFQNPNSRYSNNKGEFIFENLKAGIYTVIISREEYFSSIRTVSLDSSNSSIELSISLRPFESSTDTISVSATYYMKTDDVNTSYTNTVNEEIRKSPGALEDVVKYYASSPGVSESNDINNEIIVRGGSPAEVLTIIDGLEIQNPNHYAAPGSSNGVLSYINLKMVGEVDFFSGGFPSRYGDKVSGVMDIKLKEGKKTRHLRDINLSATGYGAFFEGPITSNSSYMLSVRRSYLDLLKDYINMIMLPSYWDINTKLNYVLSPKDNLSISGLFALDNAVPVNEGDYVSDTVNVKILTAGMKYTKKEKDISLKLVAGYNWNFYKVDLEEFFLDINDNEVSFRQELDLILNNNFSLNVFTQGKHFFSKYNVNRTSQFNASNYYSPPVFIDNNVKTYKLAGGFNVTSYLFKRRLTVNAGLRFDSFQLINDKLAVSPRLGLSYKLASNTVLNGSAGIYYQAPEILWVIVNEDNRDLDYIRVEEIVLGLEQYFPGNIKLNIEPYVKQYYDYPVSVYDPNYIFINSGVDLYPNFIDKALSAGKGYFMGIDVLFQKKNSGSGLYWTAAYSWSKSEFLALTGDIQPAEFEYTNQLSLIMGYKFKFGLSISSRFKYADGRPYTPFDAEKSNLNNRGIYERSLYNKSRMPAYGRLDIRVDQNLRFGRVNMNMYIDLINALDRVNYYIYRWSSYDKLLVSDKQISRVPVVGISVQF